jgi:hypothetical protein
MRFKLSLVMLFVFLTNLTFVNTAEASCVGSECNDKDPIREGCTDGREVAREDFGVYSFGSWWSRQERKKIISLIYSEKCKANWSKADVPAGTKIYIEEKYAPGNKRGYSTTQVNGQSYGNMSTGNVPNRACALLPSKIYPTCTLFK